MTSDKEVAIVGWKDIAGIFGKSASNFCMAHKEELLNAGVIYYSNFGRPPRRMVCAFPSILKAWAGRKGQKGEPI